MTKKNIVVIGGGPAGSFAATLLAGHGHNVVLFHSAKRPELIVGESLLPAVLTYLNQIGVEEEVKSYSTYKPGATIVFNEDTMASFDFNLAKTKNRYAYNIPRDKFDQTLLNAARRSGVKIINKHAEIVSTGKNSIQLKAETRNEIGPIIQGNIDLIIDASGRQRLIPKTLHLPTIIGGRRDIALFSHMSTVDLISKGNIHVDRLEF